jgi:hypothetical protein
MITCHQRWAPSSCLRIWVGVSGITAPGALRFMIDGAPVAPSVVRRLQSARPQGSITPNTPRVFTGVYELAGLQADKTYSIRVEHDAESVGPVSMRTMMSELPSGMTAWFNVLLVSCFHHDEAPRGVLDLVVREVVGEQPVHLALLLGDQVYLDQPTLKDFPENGVWLAAKFEEDYRRNWFTDGLGTVLRSFATISIPDDHEYWNNFPYPFPFVATSLTSHGRNLWQQAARSLFEAFQAAWPAPPGVPLRIDVPPVSLLIADTRTDRQPTQLMSAAALGAVGAWVDAVNINGWNGVFVSGQSLLDAPGGAMAKWFDGRSLADHSDYRALLGHLNRLSRSWMALTGDLHWGRVSTVRDAENLNRIAAYEIVSSPSALVTTPVVDTATRIGSWIKGVFGSADPWPRHPGVTGPEDYLARRVLGSRFTCKRSIAQKGDQIALVSFRRQGFGVVVRVTYYPVHPDYRVRARLKSAFECELSKNW